LLALSRRLRLASLQRVVGAVVQAAYFLAAETLFTDLEISTDQGLGWEFLYRELDGIGSARESLVADGLAAGCTSAAGEELRLGAEIEGTHVGQSLPLAADPLNALAGREAERVAADNVHSTQATQPLDEQRLDKHDVAHVRPSARGNAHLPKAP
jgi:hypothetical protein